MIENNETKQEYITEEKINEYLTQHTYIDKNGNVNKTKQKYFIKD